MVNDQKITENFQNFEKNSIINNSGTENLGLNSYLTGKKTFDKMKPEFSVPVPSKKSAYIWYR